MPSYKTERPFTDADLKTMDIIHNPKTSLFTDQNDKSYCIKNFISEEERLTLLDFWNTNFDTAGEIINEHIYRITYPMAYPIISDIIRPKICAILNHPLTRHLSTILKRIIGISKKLHIKVPV